MTIYEPCLALTGLAGAIAGGAAGSNAGFAGGAVGALAGGLVSIVAAAIAVGALGADTAYFVQRDEKAANGAALEAPPPSKLQELVFLVLVSPVVLAPVWAPLLVYRIGLLIVGAT